MSTSSTAGGCMCGVHWSRAGGAWQDIPVYADPRMDPRAWHLFGDPHWCSRARTWMEHKLSLIDCSPCSQGRGAIAGCSSFWLSCTLLVLSSKVRPWKATYKNGFRHLNVYYIRISYWITRKDWITQPWDQTVNQTFCLLMSEVPQFCLHFFFYSYTDVLVPKC